MAEDKDSHFNGYRIVVLDRGFVYVGYVERRLADSVSDPNDKDMLIITEARNIRRWGTDEGLGQLALKGPQGDTVLDKCGVVIAPWHALQHVMVTDPAMW